MLIHEEQQQHQTAYTNADINAFMEILSQAINSLELQILKIQNQIDKMNNEQRQYN